MFAKNLVVTCVAIASMAIPAFSQSENPGRNEVSVQAFGSFVKNTTDNGIENKATNSGGVLSSYRAASLTRTTESKPTMAILSTLRATPQPGA